MVSPALSLVIPAYDEERRLGPGLRRALDYLRERGEPFEVLVVDDGSRDRTREVAATFAGEGVTLLRHERNRGKGAAIRTGLAASRGARVLLTDADFSTPIEELAKLEPHLARAPLVIGSRGVADSSVQKRQPIYRELMGKTFNRAVRLLGVRGLNDTQCGFKLLQGDAGRQLAQELKIEGFAYDVELIWLARRHGWNVAEVGVVWINSEDSRVSPIRSSLSMLRDLLRIRWIHRHDAGTPKGGESGAGAGQG